MKTKTQLPDLCYGLLETEMRNPSLKTVTPIIIKRGEKGYYRTNWDWNKEHAIAALADCNAGLGVTPDVAKDMMGQSMFGWRRGES